MRNTIEILILIFFFVDCLTGISSFFRIKKVIKMDTEKRVEELRKHSHLVYDDYSIDLKTAIEIVRKGSVSE